MSDIVINIRAAVKGLLLDAAAKHGRVIGIDGLRQLNGRFTDEEMSEAARRAQYGTNDPRRSEITAESRVRHGVYDSETIDVLVIRLVLDTWDVIELEYEGTVNDLLLAALGEAWD